MILSFMYRLLLIIRVTGGHSLHGQLFQLFWATPRYSQAIGEIICGFNWRSPPI